MSFLSVLIMFLSFGTGLFAVRELKILAEGDVERYQVVRAISLVTMTITPYFLPGTLEHRGCAHGIIGPGRVILTQAERLLVGDGSGSECVGG
jgi:hypothetical protein